MKKQEKIVNANLLIVVVKIAVALMGTIITRTVIVNVAKSAIQDNLILFSKQGDTSE